MKINFNSISLFFFLALGLVSCEIFQGEDRALEEGESELLIQDTLFTFGLSHRINSELNDEGSDLNWDWEASDRVLTYVDFEGQLLEDVISLPWYTQGSPLNLVYPDIKAEDGWTLLMRDFGTENRGIIQPYISLYNTRTGQLLLTIRNTRTLSGSFAQGKITLKTLSGEVLDSFESGQEKFNQFDGWFIFRFDLKDSNVDFSSSSLEILFEGVGVSETRIQF